MNNQTNRDFVVIVVDDCSDDYNELEMVIEDFSERLTIKYYRLKVHSNGAAARNYGIMKVRTPYVCFLDADDHWVCNRIELAYCSIERAGKEDLLEYSCYKISPTGYISPKRKIREDELVSEYVFFHDMSMQTSTFLMSSVVARSVLFDETLSRHQDSSFMMRAQDMGYSISFREDIINNYVISNIDFRNRVLTGRISTQFCNEFLKNYQKYFSLNAELGYLFNVYLRVALIERSGLIAVTKRLLSYGQIGDLLLLIYLKLRKRFDRI
ncbi:glycosyltransferase family 2 protein [Schleiferiaceae bacterium]|nr:glycosyltransferase family 2 protein [Schleiferiaceae bacterium]